MTSKGPWEHMTPSDWDALVKSWLAELRVLSPPRESDVDEPDVGQTVVLMGFMAPPQKQWEFICSAVAYADSDDELSHIAAGPVEQLLGQHGEAFIPRVEARAATDRRFARMLTGVWRHTMSDDVWTRVQAIQSGVADPLSGEEP